jgi:large subunit ribosomal protein L15
MGSGKGRYAGRGIKGQKARSGSRKPRPGFEGGQMPLYMRLGKQRGPHSKDAMPIGPFRTFTYGVNVRQLERFEAGAEITPDVLKRAGLVGNRGYDVKILGGGELTKKLTVVAHRFSATAREKITDAGGTVVELDEERAKPRGAKRTARDAEATAAPAREAGAKGEEKADAAVDTEPTDDQAIADAVQTAGSTRRRGTRKASPAETGGEAEASAGREGSEGDV